MATARLTVPGMLKQNGHDPISPRDALPENDLVFFLIDLIGQLDLTPFHQYYARELRGQPPFDVTMMVTLLVYAYSVGVCSSRKINAACERNLAFRAIVGDDRPDFRTISDFRKIHRMAMKSLFIEVLRVAGKLGMVKLGNLSTDGTKMRANASRHKAMSYGYMNKEIDAAGSGDRAITQGRRAARRRARRGAGKPSWRRTARRIEAA